MIEGPAGRLAGPLVMSWRVQKHWAGETCFVVAGGPSARDLPPRLDGENLIVVNSSYRRLPLADYLFFGDARWWEEELCSHEYELGTFGGDIVTCAAAVTGPQVLRLKRINPPPLADDPGTVAMRKTSLTGAINLAVHLGVARIVLVGADCKPGADGRTHHHAPHPWPQTATCYAEWIGELTAIAPALDARKVTVVNASPGSALTCWPIVSLEDALRCS